MSRPWLRKLIPQKRWRRGCVYTLCVLLTVLACDMLLVQYWRRITLGHDTTRLTAPFTADGRIDYVAAVNQQKSAGITPENNAAPLIVLAVGPHHALADFWSESNARQLGVDPAADESHAFSAYFDWLAAQGYPAQSSRFTRFDDELTQLRRQLWSRQDHAEVAQWIDANQDALDLLVQATQRPRFYLPMFPPDPPAPPSVASSRIVMTGWVTQMAVALACRANLRLHDGDLTGFESDVFAAFKLARLLAQGSTILCLVNASQINTLAAHAVDAAALSNRLTALTARHLGGAMRQLEILPINADQMDTEQRYQALDFLCCNAAYGLKAKSGIAMFELDQNAILFTFQRLEPILPIDYNAALRRVNIHFDQYAAALRQPTWAQRHDAMVAAELDVYHFAAQMNGTTFKILHPDMYLAASVTWSFGRVGDLVDQSRMEQTLAEVALALAAYHADHNAYPARLEDLQPHDIPEVPLDNRINAPLHYALTPHGYQLYSVGMNGKDDGGQAYSRANLKVDDLVVRTDPLP